MKITVGRCSTDISPTMPWTGRCFRQVTSLAETQRQLFLRVDLFKWTWILVPSHRLSLMFWAREGESDNIRDFYKANYASPAFCSQNAAWRHRIINPLLTLPRWPSWRERARAPTETWWGKIFPSLRERNPKREITVEFTCFMGQYVSFLWTVSAAMKLKDSCYLKGKLWQTYTAY